MPLATLILNASELLTLTGPDHPRAGKEMSSLGLIRDGAVLVKEGVIEAVGLRALVLKHPDAGSARLLDAGGRVVMPGFVDSHTHPVFAAPRLKDFEARLKGKSYGEIAADGGGLLSSVDGVRGADQASLTVAFRQRAQEFIACGTTTLEAKSGYGLDMDTELKMLRAIDTVRSEGPLEIVATILGAHAVPSEFKDSRADYLKLVCEDMIPTAASEKLARFVDVFCDEGFFSIQEASQVLAAARKAGLGVKIHAEQLSRTGACSLAVAEKAVSADHLDHVDENDVASLSASGTVACLVPGSNYFLKKPYPPARRLIEAGAAVALATDFNPGTCPCWDMRMILSIATTQMRMTPAEVIVAATINGAHALGLGATHGSLEKGKKADILIYDAEDYREIPYYFGSGGVSTVLKGGEVVHSEGGARS